jgi:hypothetical protein
MRLGRWRHPGWDFGRFGFADTRQKLGDRYLIGPRYFVAIVDTKDWLIANIQSVKYAGAAVAFITLAFFGNGSEDSRGIAFVKFVIFHRHDS